MPFLRSIRTTLEMIKWEHSVFALPFALAGAMLAAGGWPAPRQLLWIVVAMVGARSAAMAFNRLADHSLDAANPRTAARALPAGRLTRSFVIFFVLAASLLLVLAAWQLNRLAFYLSPLALAIVFFYSFTKRFTRWSHFFLGFALGTAPAAAWIAVRGSFDARILLLTAAVTCWVAGFDVLYACQDYDFDHQAGLHSIPRWFGIPRSLLVARWLHVAMLLLLVGMALTFQMGRLMELGILVVALLLGYEHSLVRPHDLRRLDAAFFAMNGVISLVFFCFVALDLLLLRR